MWYNVFMLVFILYFFVGCEITTVWLQSVGLDFTEIYFPSHGIGYRINSPELLPQVIHIALFRFRPLVEAIHYSLIIRNN